LPNYPTTSEAATKAKESVNKKIASLSAAHVASVSMSTRTLLLIILILLLIGAFPAWPYSTGWGYYPVGGIGLILLIVLILVLLGQI
jgi:hypothetical protein